MCGIIGYVGEDDALGILLDGLKRLEYRGYDSAGIAVLKNNRLELRRSVGKLINLEKIIKKENLKSGIGIGHTRWATHGRPTSENAHPHTDCKNEIAIVHNGIIENFKELRNKLITEGHKFKSETDTEVFAHLIEKYLKETSEIEVAVIKACKEVEGTFALGVISKKFPDKLIAARCGSPLVIGIGEVNNELFIASDIPAILNKTRKVIILEEEEIATISKDGFSIRNFENKKIEKKITTIEWDPITAEKGGYKHFMLKEIFEQPQVLEDTLRGRVFQDEILLDEINIPSAYFNKLKKIIILACGTAWHAGLVGKFMFEEIAKIPTEVDYASEFRYRDPIITDNNLIIAISQSGETADTLAAVREAKNKGAKILAICNCLGSTLTREADGNLYTHAGPEIGVASTKAFTSQLATLYILALYIAKINCKKYKINEMLHDLRKIPASVSKILKKDEEIQDIAKKYFKCRDFLYLGRRTTYPIALEGALKLKEISYIHAEGYAAGEMKHGPIALIDENMPVVAIATKSRTYEKIISNIEEVKARDGIVIALATEKDNEIKKRVDHCIFVPPTNEMLLPILTVVPLQLLAYHISVRRGCDVDQPRNLAKSVTVE